MEYYSAIKKNEFLPFATTWMDLDSNMLGEVSHMEKDKHCMWNTYMWNLKNMKNKQAKKQLSSQIMRIQWWLPEVEAEEWVKWVKEVERYTLSVIK